MKKDEREINLYIETMNQVTIHPKMVEEIKENVKIFQKTHKKERRYFVAKRAAILVASLVLLILIGVPAVAKVQSLIRERMEKIPDEKVDTMLNHLDEQQTEENLYSREFTDTEYRLLAELEKQYREGLFPTGEIMQVEREEQIDPDKLCYLTTTGCYFFPEREMTEEELLEFIDFQQVLGYGLNKRYEELYGAERKEEEEIEEETIGRIVSEGGISEEKAVEIAAAWMDELYPARREGMEVNAYLYSSEETPMEENQSTLKYKNLYMVYFGVIHDNYYFYIDADTGMMTSFIHTTGHTKELDSYKVTEEEIRNAIENYLPDAKMQLTETIGIQDYDDVFALFTVSKEGISEAGTFTYHFITNEGDDYVLRYLAKTGEWMSYDDTLYPDFIELAEKSEVFLKEHQENYEEKVRYRVELK